MARPGLRDIASKLHERTSNHELRWRETADPNAYRVAFPGGLIRVRRYYADYEDKPTFEIVYVSPEGEELDSMWEGDGSLISVLYDEARASAIDLDSKLQDLLGEVASGKETDPPLDEKK